MPQPNRVTHMDPSKRTPGTEHATDPAPREYHHPLEGLSHPIVIGIFLATGEAMTFLGIFFGLRLSFMGFYIMGMIFLATRAWINTKSVHPFLDGEYAWIVRLLVAIIGCVFVEVGITMRLSWQAYATQAFGFSIPIAYTIILLYFTKQSSPEVSP